MMTELEIKQMEDASALRCAILSECEKAIEELQTHHDAAHAALECGDMDALNRHHDLAMVAVDRFNAAHRVHDILTGKVALIEFPKPMGNA